MRRSPLAAREFSGSGAPAYRPDREAQVLGAVRKAATDLAGPLTAEAVVRIFERIIDEARRAERHESEHRQGPDPVGT